MNLRVRTTGFSRSAMIAVGVWYQIIQASDMSPRVAPTFVKLLRCQLFSRTDAHEVKCGRFVKPKRLR